ncbi:MAG: HU family DNA-binding protein [Bilophila sp.]
MTKGDLIAQIAAKANINKTVAEAALSAMLEATQEILVEDGKLTLTGFGTFVVEERKERQGRNPRSGEAITIAASRVVRFRPGKTLKEAAK